MNYTPSQIAANEQRKKFHAGISAKNAELNRPQTDRELYAALNAVEPVEPEPEATRKEPWFYQPRNHVVAGKISAISISDVQHAACRHFGISLSELRKTRRLYAVVRPRQIAMYLCRELTIRSLPEIGRMFGGYDHTTVLHAGRQIEKLIKSDWLIAYDVAHIERLLA